MQGEYRADRIVNGSGIHLYDDGKRYIGQWRDGRRHGQGVLIDGSGNVLFRGRWSHDERVEIPRSTSEPAGK
jgi:hypothetical protein